MSDGQVARGENSRLQRKLLHNKCVQADRLSENSGSEVTQAPLLQGLRARSHCLDIPLIIFEAFPPFDRTC
jgi:hypothetical protein